MGKYKIESVTLSHGGKGLVVRRKLPNGKIQNVCECWDNADFSRGCIAQVDVDLLQEVVDNHGTYARGNFERYLEQGVSKNCCVDCYSFTNTTGVLPRIVNEKTRKSFERLKPSVVRIGKNTECGHPYYFATLKDFFDMATNFQTPIIFPTRMLPFGLEGALETADYAREGNDVVARLARNAVRYYLGTKNEHEEDRMEMVSGEEMASWFRENRTSLMFTMGYENPEIEPGALSQGFSNHWILNQALRYHSQGVNVSLILNCDVAQSFEANQSRGSLVQEVLSARERTGINVRLLTRRFRSKKGFSLMGAGHKHDLFSVGCEPVIPGFNEALPDIAFPEDRFEDLYVETKKQNEFTARQFHPDFQALVDEGIGVCGQVGEYEHCDKCNLYEGARIRFPISELAPIPESKKAEWTAMQEKRKDKRRKKAVEKEVLKSKPKEENLEWDF